MADKVKGVEIDSVRERLIKLLQHDNCPLFMVFGDKVDVLADYLIANGVTVANKLKATEPLTDRQQWIPVTERLPEEHDSIFAMFYGTEKWVPGMFRTISNDVNACVEYEDGTRKVKTLHTVDGKWSLKGMGGKKVTHWKHLPEPPKGE